MNLSSSELLKAENLISNAQVCEFVTGLKPTDPRLLDRFEEDQLIIREKYKLPSAEMLIKDPAEYERKIREVARIYGIRIVSTAECGDYFSRFPNVDAVFLNDAGGMRIGVDINRSDQQEYTNNLGKLEHELIHAIQRLRYPGLSPELMEYEAYIVNFDIKKLRELETEDAAYVIFSGLYLGSVRHIYEELGQKPPWGD